MGVVHYPTGTYSKRYIAMNMLNCTIIASELINDFTFHPASREQKNIKNKETLRKPPQNHLATEKKESPGSECHQYSGFKGFT